MKTTEGLTTFSLGDVTVTIVDRTEIRYHEHGGGFVVMVRKAPCTVAVEGKDGKRTSVAIDEVGLPADPRVEG